MLVLVSSGSRYRCFIITTTTHYYYCYGRRGGDGADVTTH